MILQSEIIIRSYLPSRSPILPSQQQSSLLLRVILPLKCGEELRDRGAKPCILLCRWCWCGDYAIIWVRSDWPCCAWVNRCLTVPSVVNRGDFNRSIRSPGRGMIGLSGDGVVGEISTGVERVELLVILLFCVFHLSLFLSSSLGISFW